MDLSTTLRELRERNHYSQKVVALRLGCSSSIISSYETGERTPSVQNLIALADLYHVSVDYLLGRSSPQAELDVSGLRPEQIDALRALINSMH